MSVEAMAWAFKQNCKGDAQLKLILLALCDHADEDGWCWPSQERLAAKAECSHDTAARRLHRLERLGFITRRRRARKTTIYRISLYKNDMKPQAVRNHDLAPSEAEKAQILNTQTPVMIPQNAVDDDATIASLTIKDNHQSESPQLFASDDAPPAKRKKRIPMPENWQPTDEGIEFAENLGFSVAKTAVMIQACRDYHLKHGTLIAGQIGLAATWRTWCNNEVKFTAEREARYGKGSGSNRQTRSETIIAASRQYASEMARRRGGEEVSQHGSGAADGGGADYDQPLDRRH